MIDLEITKQWEVILLLFFILPLKKYDTLIKR